MEVLEFSDLPHNKAPFLTVGGFLFSVPDSSHWAAHHDERTAVCKYLLQCRKGTADTSVVCYITIFIQWHIEINADNSL